MIWGVDDEGTAPTPPPNLPPFPGPQPVKTPTLGQILYPAGNAPPGLLFTGQPSKVPTDSGPLAIARLKAGDLLSASKSAASDSAAAISRTLQPLGTAAKWTALIAALVAGAYVMNTALRSKSALGGK